MPEDNPTSTASQLKRATSDRADSREVKKPRGAAAPASPKSDRSDSDSDEEPMLAGIGRDIKRYYEDPAFNIRYHYLKHLVDQGVTRIEVKMLRDILRSDEHYAFYDAMQDINQDIGLVVKSGTDSAEAIKIRDIVAALNNSMEYIRRGEDQLESGPRLRLKEDPEVVSIEAEVRLLHEQVIDRKLRTYERNHEIALDGCINAYWVRRMVEDDATFRGAVSCKYNVAEKCITPGEGSIGHIKKYQYIAQELEKRRKELQRLLTEEEIGELIKPMAESIAKDLFQSGADGRRAEDSKRIQSSMRVILQQLKQEGCDLGKLQDARIQKELVGEHRSTLSKWTQGSAPKCLAQLYYEQSKYTAAGLVTGGIHLPESSLSVEFKNKVKEYIKENALEPKDKGRS